MSRRLLPNSTQIPDLILDEWMPLLSGAEFKVVLFIARKTYGWGKEADALALNQIADGTGLGLRTVNEALHGTDRRKGLIADGKILHTPSDLPAGHPKAWGTFSLNLDAETTDTETLGTGAVSAPVPASNSCVKRTGSECQPVRKMQETRAVFARVSVSNPCENRTQQETEKHYRQETAAAHAPTYTHTREGPLAAADLSMNSASEPSGKYTPSGADSPPRRNAVPPIPMVTAGDAARREPPETFGPPAPSSTAPTAPPSPPALPSHVRALLDLDAAALAALDPAILDARFQVEHPTERIALEAKRRSATTSSTMRYVKPYIIDRLMVLRILRDANLPPLSATTVAVLNTPPANPALASMLALQRAEQERTASTTKAFAPQGAPRS